MPPKKARPARPEPGGGPLAVILAQIDTAGDDLRAYRPAEVDWLEQARTTAERVIPWLRQHAAGLKGYVQDVLNAPAVLRQMWKTLRPHVQLPEEQLVAFDRQLALDEVLREAVTGEVISGVVTKYLLAHFPDGVLASNGRSDYPDLYLTDANYSRLPSFTRKKKATPDDQYGAAVKGAAKRPVRVPDGLEIKTCRDRIAVDCHYPHAGLHIVVLFNETARLFSVSDIKLAFLRAADYRESERNTDATTVKYSFTGDQFVSLFGPQ